MPERILSLTCFLHETHHNVGLWNVTKHIRTAVEATLDDEILSRHARKRKQAKEEVWKGMHAEAWEPKQASRFPLLDLSWEHHKTKFFFIFLLFPFFFLCYYVLRINSVIFALQVNFLEQTIVHAWNTQIKRWDCMQRLNTNLKISKCLNIITSFI